MDKQRRIEPTWRRSSRCENGSCVEVARVDDCVLVRDSKNPRGPVLEFGFQEWDAFVGGVNGGEFDLPSLLS